MAMAKGYVSTTYQITSTTQLSPSIGYDGDVAFLVDDRNKRAIAQFFKRDGIWQRVNNNATAKEIDATELYEMILENGQRITDLNRGMQNYEETTDGTLNNHTATLVNHTASINEHENEITEIQEIIEHLDPSGGGVGKSTTGVEYDVDGTSYTGDVGAEVFNDYEDNKGIGKYSHTEGKGNISIGLAAHTEGYQTKTSNTGAHAEGIMGKATGIGAHVEGASTTITVDEEPVEVGSEASGKGSHVEGDRKSVV